MDNSFPQNKPDTQQPTSFLVRLPAVNNIFKWLASLIKPTDEEQENAGVYLGGEGRDRRNGEEI
jgi:hypothetical protein